MKKKNLTFHPFFDDLTFNIDIWVETIMFRNMSSNPYFMGHVTFVSFIRVISKFRVKKYAFWSFFNFQNITKNRVEDTMVSDK